MLDIYATLSRFRFLCYAHKPEQRVTDMLKNRMLLKTILVLALNTAASSAWASSYALTDLGALGGPAGYAFSINDSGDIAGYADISTNISRAALWSDGAATNLGTLGGLYSYAFGINNNGQIVGAATTTKNIFSATLWSGGTTINLGNLNKNASGQARSINDSGQIAGWSFSPTDNLQHAVLWSGGTVTDLGATGKSSQAYDINESGQIVGSSQNRAALWSGGTVTDLGTLGGSSSAAWAINDNGQAVGWSSVTGANELHATLWSGGAAIDLGTLGGTQSYAIDINYSGQVVGFSTLKDSNETHAILWSNGVTIDLNDLLPSDSDWQLRGARGINSLGQIVGWGDYNGQIRAFLLSPELQMNVPEPGSLALLGAGLFGLMLPWRYKKGRA